MKARTFRPSGPVLTLALSALLITAGRSEERPPFSLSTDEPEAGLTLAWLRFVDGDETFEDQPYYWLGRGELRLQFDVAPRAGQTLELLWGAKGDQRTATLTLNGRSQPLEAGGYRGFRWLRVPLPDGLEGTVIEAVLRATAGLPAFLAEARLTAPAGDPDRPDLRRPSHRARVLARPGGNPAGDAFPEMRAAWDGEPIVVPPGLPAEQVSLFRQADRNARLANEAFYRSRRFVDGWLGHTDPVTDLIPRNLAQSRDFWNGRDAGADNYAFMVLTAALTDRPMLEGRLLDMLRTEQRVTARRDRLADDYSFSKKSWRREPFDLEATIFDSAEYVKDGLIPLTEWLGSSPWSERMIALVEDLWKNAAIETPAGPIPTHNFEVNGDLLQSCSRLYWFTADRKYFDWAVRLGDYYLLGTNHPTRNRTELRLRDHGGEMVNGLTELYVASKHAQSEKAAAYRDPLHAIFARILEVGRNEHGMLYDGFNPQTGEHSKGICDTWGYIFDGFYTMYLLDRTESYRAAVLEALGNLEAHYTRYAWEGQSADGYADAIESALNLYNREPVASVARWLDSEIRLMWAIQKPDGIIEGWHGDGNFARTSLMFALWKTQGVTVRPWRPDVRFGAVRDGHRLFLTLMADRPWQGTVHFDRPRHRDLLHLPLDYPRINQFPEWFTAEAGGRYLVKAGADPGSVVTGRDLIAGLPMNLRAGETAWWTVEPQPAR